MNGMICIESKETAFQKRHSVIDHAYDENWHDLNDDGGIEIVFRFIGSSVDDLALQSSGC